MTFKKILLSTFIIIIFNIGLGLYAYADPFNNHDQNEMIFNKYKRHNKSVLLIIQAVGKINFVEDEISHISSYLNDMNISVNVAKNFDVTLEKMLANNLIIIHNMGWGWGYVKSDYRLTNDFVSKLLICHNKGISLYFIGDDLALSDYCSPEYLDLIGMKGTKDNGRSGSGVTPTIDAEHFSSKYGLFRSFWYKRDLDVTRSAKGNVLLKSGNIDAMISYYDGVGRVVTQLPNV